MTDLMTEQDQEDLANGRALRAMKGKMTEEAAFASFALIRLAVHVNATLTELTQNGVTLNGQPVGDWKITVLKLVDVNELQHLESLERKQMFEFAPANVSVPGHGEL